MRIVNITEAKINLSMLINAAMQGEEIIISKGGKPVIKLSPIDLHKPKRKPGAMKKTIKISKDFNKPLPNGILNQFEGKSR